MVNSVNECVSEHANDTGLGVHLETQLVRPRHHPGRMGGMPKQENGAHISGASKADSFIFPVLSQLYFVLQTHEPK